MDIAKKVAEVTDAVVAFRRFVHENAELSLQEFAATKRIVEELRKLPGIEIIDAKPGCIAVLKGKKPGKTLALRADMDALPIPEESGLPFASKNANVCHACGHDMHAAILLGCAMVLSSMPEAINGTVKFLFQPGEEQLAGARHLIRAGALENPKPDAFIALHTWPYTPVGSVSTRHGAIMASADTIEIKVTGRAGHAAYPQMSIDSIYIAAQIVTALQTIVARQTNPLDAAVVTIGQINGGLARNIIAPEVTMIGTVRTLAGHVRDAIPGQLERIVTHTAEAFGGTATLNYIMGTPPLISDDAMVDLVDEAARQTVGAENMIPLETPTMGGEDYAYFLEHAPGVFFRIGTANDDPMTRIAAHNSKIRYDEGALPIGMKVMCQAALNYLK